MAETTTRGQRRQGNLPAELSSFVDRVAERAALKRLLTASRLVTVTGVGGVGKTRTVLRVAAEVQRAFPDGAWVVDLSLLAQADLVAEAVAQALGPRDQSTRPQVEALAEYLESRRLLLVLDNCEHLADSCAQLVDSLLRAAPSMQVLATSRQPLAVQGEHVFPLPPLTVPDPGRYATGALDREPDAAVILFAERARAATPAFALTESNQAAVARLCQGLDGIPLASSWPRCAPEPCPYSRSPGSWRAGSPAGTCSAAPARSGGYVAGTGTSTCGWPSGSRPSGAGPTRWRGTNG